MTRCTQPGCPGTIVDGYCDVCGSPAAPADESASEDRAPISAGAVRLWFPVDRWASFQGLTVTGLWLGAATATPLIAWLMQGYGWQAALVITCLPSLLLVSLWYWFARDRPEQHPRFCCGTAASPPLAPRAADDAACTGGLRTRGSR
jgi:hypothetical protein